MPAPDPLAVRAYNSQVERQSADATRDGVYVADLAAHIAQELADKGYASVGDGRRLLQGVGMLMENLVALAAMRELSYLTADPDAEEA